MAKVRTQIQLEPDEHAAVKAEARRRRVSVSQAIRDMVRSTLGIDADLDERTRRFLAAAGAGREPDGRRDVARRHDDAWHGTRP
jgi:hypothetical protein